MTEGLQMRTEDIQNVYRHDFASFIHFAFKELHPYVDYQHNWHIDVIAHYLSKVENGEITRLIINLPPRMLKSHCASIAFPAFVLGRDPRKKLLYLHNGQSLGRDLEGQCATLMQSRRYRALFPQNIIRQDSDRLLTSHGGHRCHMPIMSRLTGLGADMIIIDDPISTDDVKNQHERQRLNQQFDENILQRLNNKKSGAIILVMQRLHENDLTAHLLAKNEGWVHVDIPSIALKDETWDLPHGRTHKRLKREAMHPARESIDELVETLHSVGGYAFSYQYLQGQYKPHFGEYGEGGICLRPCTSEDFIDSGQTGHDMFALFKMKESALILPKVFGIGHDLVPDKRCKITQEDRERKFEKLYGIASSAPENHDYDPSE
jgi:hypothetical protein